MAALWRSVEELSGDPTLEVASYRGALGDLECCEATEDMASSYSSVAFLFNLQVGRTFPGFVASAVLHHAVYIGACPRARCVSLTGQILKNVGGICMVDLSFQSNRF